ncbi:hypothetical protein FRUB_03870 [Fimbriiglobus ruber]|uniref:Uncharacterized protein n=2 Tax=Fimbriiglobus ruber TaxID=1908690 RepID=A0A225DK94_9BACT|nr:hypothetical protein FRUB_03870 [Fimbriiglobus ruber]
MLIPGEIRPLGQFVPEVGGKIIRFADYRYNPEAKPIWNLPGKFILAKDLEKEKKKESEKPTKPDDTKKPN